MIDHVSKKEYLAICHFQRNEITEYYIYNKLADREPDENKKQLLRQIANQEKVHYEFWQYYTKRDFKPYRLKVLLFNIVSYWMGITYSIKRMEDAEHYAQILYSDIVVLIPDVKKLIEEENDHEAILIAMLNDYQADQ